MDPSANSIVQSRSDLPCLLMRLLGGGLILFALCAAMAAQGATAAKKSGYTEPRTDRRGAPSWS